MTELPLTQRAVAIAATVILIAFIILTLTAVNITRNTETLGPEPTKQDSTTVPHPPRPGVPQ